MKKLFLLVFSMLIITSSVSFAAEKVSIYAAASTTNMIDEIIAAYNKKSGNAVSTYGASGALAKQIEQGAPAGIFISANPNTTTYYQ